MTDQARGFEEMPVGAARLRCGEAGFPAEVDGADEDATAGRAQSFGAIGPIVDRGRVGGFLLEVHPDPTDPGEFRLETAVTEQLALGRVVTLRSTSSGRWDEASVGTAPTSIATTKTSTAIGVRAVMRFSLNPVTYPLLGRFFDLLLGFFLGLLRLGLAFFDSLFGRFLAFSDPGFGLFDAFFGLL